MGWRGRRADPSLETLALRIGVEPRTIQRRITRLAKDGLLERVQRRDGHGVNKTNVHRLTPLVEKAKPFAIELLEERQARKRDKTARQKRKRLVLQLVRSKKT